MEELFYYDNWEHEHIMKDLHIENLKVFEIYSRGESNEEAIELFVKNHPKLTELRLNVDARNLKTMELILRNLKDLKKLMLKVNPNYTVENPKKNSHELIREFAPNLENLALNFGVNYTRWGVKYSTEEMKRKRSFEENFGRELPNLKINLLFEYVDCPWD